MNENEIMELEEIGVNNEPETAEEGKNESNFGFGVFIGSVLTMATIAGVKAIREFIANRKTKEDIPTVVAEVVGDDENNNPDGDIVDENDE